MLNVVNMLAHEETVKKFSREDGRSLRIGMNSEITETVPLSEPLLEDYRQVLGSVKKCEVLDYNILGFIYKEFEKYKAGECTAEQAAEEIQRKIMQKLSVFL